MLFYYLSTNCDDKIYIESVKFTNYYAIVEFNN